MPKVYGSLRPLRLPQSIITVGHEIASSAESVVKHQLISQYQST